MRSFLKLAVLCVLGKLDLCGMLILKNGKSNILVRRSRSKVFGPEFEAEDSMHERDA